MIRGESRAPADPHAPRAGLLLALFAAALLRFWALPQGVPFGLQVDEPEVMDRAVRMMKTGDFGPHFFDYPALYMYVQAAVAALRFIAGAMRGRWGALAQVTTADFYVWARAVTAILGTATVWIVYRAGLRWSARTALLAAVMIAVMPLHVRESHYVLTDVPMTFLVMLTLLLSLRAHERSTAWSFALAGAAAGLAGATKYNGVLAVLMPLLVALITPAARPSRPIAILCIVGAMLAAFFLAAPYTFLDLPTFLNQFARLASEYRAPGASADPVWQTYLKHLRTALAWPGVLLVIAGIVFGFWRMVRGPERLKWVLVIVFPVAYFRFVSQQNIAFARYLLPLVPFLSLLAAAAVVWIVDWLRQVHFPRQGRNLVTVALTLAAIGPPGYAAIQWDAAAARVWTTQQAYEWIRADVPPDSSIRLEGSLAIKLPPPYRASYVKQLRMDSVKVYAGSGIQYLVASSQCYGPYFEDPARFQAEYFDYQRIFSQTEEVARFKPTAEHPGPELIILKVKK
jgi:4-amino-4-deoxy-L-arabinose transferase-like glycosyltransferase